MEKQRIIRLRRLDAKASEGDFCLLSATQTGSRALDLMLVGTEGSEAYEATLKHAGVPRLRSSGFGGSAGAWEAVVKHTLGVQGGDVDKRRGGDDDEEETELARFLRDVELCCEVKQRGKSVTTLELVWLEADGEEGIALYDWLGVALAAQVKQTDSQAVTVAELNAKIKDVESKLEQLVEAKKTYEDQLLGKFCLLLNEKKAKIRELQMVIADGDGTAPQARQSASTPATPSKKKAPAKPAARVVTESESESSDSAFESVRRGTPPRDSDSDGEARPAPRVKGTIGGKARVKREHDDSGGKELPKSEEKKKGAVKGVIGKGGGAKSRQPKTTAATSPPRAEKAGSVSRKAAGTKPVGGKAGREAAGFDTDDSSSDGFDTGPAAHTRAHDGGGEDDDGSDADRMDIEDANFAAKGKAASSLPPPRRELPFQKKGVSPKAAMEQRVEEEDSETDDEL